jgi:hypothetical protein
MRPGRDAELWCEGHADLRERLHVGCLHRADLHGSRDPNLRQVRNANAHVRRKHRHVVGLGVMHEGGRVQPKRDAKMWQRRHADLQ